MVLAGLILNSVTILLSQDIGPRETYPVLLAFFRDEVFRHFRHKYESLKLRGSLCILRGNCISSCLATCQKLTYRHLGAVKGCPHCGEVEETINHLLFHCLPSRQRWALSLIPTSGNIFPRNSLL
ncbi:putative reverse transcriptase zinc-binding domain-containing protein [Arabidopsis thaliana]